MEDPDTRGQAAAVLLTCHHHPGGQIYTPGLCHPEKTRYTARLSPVGDSRVGRRSSVLAAYSGGQEEHPVTTTSLTKDRGDFFFIFFSKTTGKKRFA